ncbi:MAG: amino acid adenylation domain-containing protein [Ardenticatenaceae bacterium]|nr:amino acid adenylation domain-containing protein [Ardenticatenaceae bacterium]MCB9442816.1 amino acid adenylation domain-containing protein [Ardenticatenaceae bacterium]
MQNTKTSRDQQTTLSNSQHQNIFQTWNQTRYDFPQEKPVHQRFEEVTDKYPDAIALVYRSQQLTYRELNGRANHLAHQLRQKGIGPDTFVAFLMDRSVEMMVATLAILKAGGAYVPLDPAYPEERLIFMLEDTQAPILITQPHLLDSLPPHKAEIITLDAGWGEDASQTGNLENHCNGENLAYVMYTSGSTGQPKGVMIPHRGIMRLVLGANYAKLNTETIALQLAPVSFDAATLEIWGPLLNGGRCVLYPENGTPDPRDLQIVLHENKVNVLWLTASLFNVIVAEAPETLLGVKQVLTGGEALSVAHIRRASEHLPGTELINGYGPTECTTFSTTYSIPLPVPDDWTAIPIGHPIVNTTTYILDKDLQPVLVGERGELYVGGLGVARGYLNRPELTTERFLPDPFTDDSEAKMYKTGDVVRYLSDGRIDFIGREDDQVKIRGYRIEMGEVEAHLSQHPNIRDAKVIVHPDPAGNKQLAGYLTSRDGADLDITGIREFMKNKVSDYMIPAYLIQIEQIPLTPNGKLDKKALPAPTQAAPAHNSDYIAPRAPAEKEVAAIMAQVLNTPQVSVEDNFFDIGGTSILGIQVVSLISKKFGTDLRVVKLYEYPTIRSLAAYLDDGQTDDDVLQRIQARQQKSRQPSEGIAIIGMALRFPGANSVDELWQVLREGRATTTFFADDEIDPSEPEALRHDPGYVKANGIVTDADKFDAKFFGINPRVAQVTDPQQRVFLELAWAALEDAGYDPDQYDGEIGLYAGMGENTYRRKQVENRPDLIRAVGEFQVMLGNEKDYVATHTSYKLNLTGPSISLTTACSTSLVAIAEAYKGLNNHDCDMAISGGISIKTPQNIGYLYQEGGMLSRDGLCRPFDAESDGTMFNNGAGIVILKRLEDATTDGDRIIAVIKGVGVNNDGADKVSFTAPSVTGQAKAIAMAQADAGIDLESISYIETHGTATPLGDPIEIEALTKAFRTKTDKVGYCGIGSIKSNLGHMVAAAGVAGVIKTALAMQHKQIPATLHFKRPNPAINIEQTPFYVVDKLTDWPESKTPRRAGVSSFGVGGTNAHIIMEEAPPVEESGEARPYQTIMLSAKTEEALAAMTDNLANHLAQHPDLPLADVAFTLQAGRKSFNHRCFVTARTTGEAVGLMQSGKAPTKYVDQRDPEIVFVFPGQGSQYVNMGLNLYQMEPLFREIVDQCAVILQPYLGRDLRQVIFPAPGDEEAAAAILKDTFFTQPALFVIEYALAQLWLSWGIKPAAMIGHSVGEYVAACLAGVFSLEDALKVIASRGRLVSELPSGAMLSVRRPAADIEPLLSGQMSLAASNSPKLCVVSGPDDEIAELENRLKADGFACKHLHTSHAFHSPMMEPAIAPFMEIVSQIKLAAPVIPIVSTVTGDWMQAGEATNPQYWASHVRNTVRFAEAVAKVWEVPQRVLLEVGPRQSSTTLARQQVTNRAVQIAIPSLNDTSEDDSEWQALMDAIGRLWQAGVQFNWSDLYHHESRRRVSLPTYPFARTRFWADPPEQPEIVATAVATPPSLYLTAQEPEMTPGPISPAKTPSQKEVRMSRKERLIPRLSELLEDISGLDVDPAEVDVTFLEFGFDSLFLTQASLALKNEFNIDLSFRQMLDEYATLDTLAAYIDSQLPASAFPDETPAAQPAAAVPAATAVPAPAPAPAIMPAFSPAQFTGPTVGQSAVEQLVAQQLQLMAQQLALLGGVVPAAPSPVAAPAPVPEPAKPVVVETAVTPLPQNGTTQTAPANGTAKTETEETQPKKMQPFGAIARISTEHTDDLSPAQRDYLQKFIERYNTYTAKSKSFTAEHRPHHADPRVVTGFKPALKELIYPIVVERSEGVHFHDLDGNKYIDILNGFGSNFLGYGHPAIKDAIHRQVEAGYELGPQQVLTGETAKLVCEFTGMDRAGFCNTGSEAVMGCMRIARTVTGRRLIAIFSGSYHGIFDEVLVRGTKKLRSLPAAPGVMPSTVENVLVLDYGTEESLQILRERGPELAAIMVESIQSRRPDFQPREFIQECRRICDENGSALIFDEVITGFRMGPGGAQEYYGIKADIASYGKVAGGNMPIGIIAGKREWMDALDGGGWQYGDDSVPEVGVTYFAGTFVRHPFAMATTHAALTYLKEQGPGLQKHINGMTARLVKELNSYFEAVQVPMEIRSFSSLFKLFWKEEVPYSELFFYLMRLNGIHIYDGFPCFLTAAFTDEHVNLVIDAFKRTTAELQTAGFLPAPPAAATAAANQPPVPGARLGRDANGNPAWFVADPERPGKYLQVG